MTLPGLSNAKTILEEEQLWYYLTRVCTRGVMVKDMGYGLNSTTAIIMALALNNLQRLIYH